MGACFYFDIPDSPQFFELTNYDKKNVQVQLRWVNPEVTTQGNVLDSVATILIWRNDSLIQQIQNLSDTDTLIYTDIIVRPDYYRYSICAVDSNSNTGRILYSNNIWLGGDINGIVIWDLDKTPISGSAISNSLADIGYERYVYNAEYSAQYSLDSTVEAVFVCLGISGNNHVLSFNQGQQLADYLNIGGRVYMEGGDTWYIDSQTPVHFYFDIHPIDNGGPYLFHVSGINGTSYDSMYFDYIGENSSMDQIEPVYYSFKILDNADLNTGVGVAYDAGSYKTIGMSLEFGGLVDGVYPSTKSALMKKILDFFDINIVTGTESEFNNSNYPQTFTVNQNYPNPFNNSTRFQVNIPQTGKLLFQIFDINGKRIYEQNIGDVKPANLSVRWDGKSGAGNGLASGVYFYKFVYTANNTTTIKSAKMIYLK